MAVEVIAGDKAWATYRRNGVARWPTRAAPERLHPLAAPQASQVFPLRREDRIFCIGSCFAREIEIALQGLGFEVMSLMRDFPTSPNRTRSDRSMFNKYNVATILNELRWALDEGTPYRHDDVFIGAPGDLLLQDYQLAGPSYAEEPGYAHAFREGFNSFFRTVRDCDVVVLTLGLSEVWFDKATGLHLNHAVTEHLVATWPGRFELHVFDHAQTLALLEDTWALLQRRLKPGFRLMITVSPVPLWASFRDQDVLMANTYSKSVLRAAIDPFVAGKSNVSYFPSYEFAMLSDPAVVWQRDDFRHVDPAFVDYIIESVLEQYGDMAGQTPESRALTRLHILQKAGLPTTSPGAPHVPWWMRLQHLFGRGRRGREVSPILGNLDRWDGRFLTGWAFSPKEPGPATMQVMLDGRLLFKVRADVERPDVAAVHGEGRRHSGFHIAIEPDKLQGKMLSVVVRGRTLKSIPLDS